jgi:hypothetical protein
MSYKSHSNQLRKTTISNMVFISVELPDMDPCRNIDQRRK